MNSREYEKKILSLLEKKYSRRKVGSNRSVLIRSSELLKNYSSPTVDLNERNSLDEAVLALEEQGWIKVQYRPFSRDIQTIMLVEEHIQQIIRELQEKYGLCTMDSLAQDLISLIREYEDRGELAASYCRSLHVKEHLDLEHERDVLKALVFLEHNERDLYIREASMLIYGDSKKLERQVLSGVASFLQTEEEGRIFERYHILEVDQELHIKGDLTLEIGDRKLDLKEDWQGMSLSYTAALRITKVTLKTPVLLTIENKTAYERFKEADMCAFYLGGFANHQQVDFLKRVIEDNPGVRLMHTGDIDIGGFLIHQDLCVRTGRSFELWKMGIDQLSDPRFASCLKKLTDRDRVRGESLLHVPLYAEVLAYMFEKDVKLEQEIIVLLDQEEERRTDRFA